MHLEEKSAPQDDYVFPSSKVYPLLLPHQVNGLQDDKFILFVESSPTSSWSNFVKPGEYDAGAYAIKKKEIRGPWIIPNFLSYKSI